MSIIRSQSTSDSLLDRFIASFEKADEMIAHDTDFIARKLITGESDEYGFHRWRPKKLRTDVSALDTIYAKLQLAFLRFFSNWSSLIDGHRFTFRDIPCLLTLPAST